jgi:hypothetical protein
MIARPSWEKPLRRKLRKWRKSRITPRWIADHGGVLFVLFSFQWVLAHGGEQTFGDGGGGTGIGAISGLIGSLLATSLRARWQSHGWLLGWTPATPAVAWKLRTREHLSTIVFTVLGTLLLSCLTAGVSVETSVATALAASALSLGCGFVLAGGRISTRLLIAGVILVLFYTVIGGWSGFGESEFSLRIAKGAGLVWLPILPWSLATHGTPAPQLHLGILVVALLISLYEWRSAWSHRTVTAHGDRETGISAGLAWGEPIDHETTEENEDPPTSDEEQRQNIRQHVAFAWFGMAGYMPDGPMPRFERLLWRWLSPRQRFLSCLGSQQAAEWFPRTRWTAATLALMAVLALLVPWLEGPAWIDDYRLWVWAGSLGLATVAILTGWPGRDSCFQSWLDLMHTADLGQFPAFAVLPVTPNEWVRAVAKEWIVRSAWISLLWSVAILIGRAGIAPHSTLSWLLAFVALPWLILAAWFPLSVLHRLVRAVSGPAFRSHGVTRVLPALASAVMGLIAVAVAFVGIGAGEFTMTSVSLAVAALLGAFSVWQTLRRCGGMRLDLKPKPLG